MMLCDALMEVGVVGMTVISEIPVWASEICRSATIGSQIWIQLKDVLITLVYSGAMSFILFLIIGKIGGGLRIECEGLDLNIHGKRVNEFQAT